MCSFIPQRSIFGLKRSSFYLCECPKCGFRQPYELGDPSLEIINGEEEPDSMKTVEKIPTVCPKCGAKWKKTNMPDLRKY